MRKTVKGLLLLTLVLTLSLVGSTFAQGTTPITPDNAATITQLNRLGRGYITDLAFTPDSATLVVVGSVGAWIYDAAAPDAEPTLLVGHTEPVISVAISPDGSVVATGSRDDTVKLWEVASGSELSTLEGMEGDIEGLTFSPDGSLLVGVGSYDYAIAVWDPAAGSLLTKLEDAHTSSIYDVAFSPDGSVLATASGDYSVKLWDMSAPNNPTELAVLEGHTSWVNAVEFSPDGSVLASGSDDDSVRLWDLNSVSEITAITPESGSDDVEFLYFTPDGSTLITGSGSFTGRVRTWDAASGAETNMTELPGGVVAGALAPDGSVLAVVKGNWDISLWDVAGFSELAVIEGHTESVDGIVFSPDGSIISSADEFGGLTLRDPLSGEILQYKDDAFSIFAENRTTSLFTPDGSILVTKDSFEIKVWDAATGGLLHTLDVPEGFPETLEITPDGSVLFLGVSNGDILVWDMVSGNQLTTLVGHTEEVQSLDMHPDGLFLASSSRDGTVRIWGLE